MSQQSRILGHCIQHCLLMLLLDGISCQGNDVFFLTGTDEHGQKIAQAAAAAGKEPKDFVDSFIPDYKNAWQMYDIQYDKFIRTTDDYHVKGVQKFITCLIDNGYVYKSVYKGMVLHSV